MRHLGRFNGTDAPGLRCSPIGDARRRGRDQEPEPDPDEEGELVCRLAQTGADNWHGTDGSGRRLAIRRISDGSLEIRHLAEGASDEGAQRPGNGLACGRCEWCRFGFAALTVQDRCRSDALLTSRAEVRIPTEVARDSGMISPTIPI